jgi:hypothetical protein
MMQITGLRERCAEQGKLLEQAIAERDELKDVLFRVTEAAPVYHDDGSCVLSDKLSDRCREALK